MYTLPGTLRMFSTCLCFLTCISRPKLPNVDPTTGVRDKAVPFKVLMKFRTGLDPKHLNKPCFGCNGVPSGSGVVRVGDPVKVLQLAGSIG